MEELLTLTRLEHAPGGTVAVDLGAAVAECCELWAALAEERGVHLQRGPRMRGHACER